MLKEPSRSVWPSLSAGEMEKNNVLGTVVSLGAPGTLRTWTSQLEAWRSPGLHHGCQKQRLHPVLGDANRHQPPCKPAGTAQAITEFLGFPGAIQQPPLSKDVAASSVSWLWPPRHSHSRPPLPSLLPVPGAACQGRLAWGQPRVWRSCQRSGTPGAPAGGVTRGALPAAGCSLRALPAPGGSR